MKTTLFIATALIPFQLFQSCKEKDTSCNYLAKGEVCIVLKNRSGKNIQSVELLHENGKSEIVTIKDNENGAISFNSPGENAYTITATFDDGKKVKSKETYIESGYKMIETIHKDTIVTKHAIW
ncbi:hypothetical protein [Flavobacterium sp. GCM10023249]|uniref:hypothetical protein n=1 Tax=unclassified Flavobacterium TaxID=196869 RepID=UPI0036091795